MKSIYIFSRLSERFGTELSANRDCLLWFLKLCDFSWVFFRLFMGFELNQNEIIKSRVPSHSPGVFQLKQIVCHLLRLNDCQIRSFISSQILFQIYFHVACCRWSHLSISEARSMWEKKSFIIAKARTQLITSIIFHIYRLKKS